MNIGNFEPLALRKEIIKTNKNGQIIKANAIMIKYLITDNEKSKIAFSIRKKVAKANKRNKIKRRIREILRKTNLTTSFYCIIIAKQEVLEYSFKELEKEIIETLSKIEKNASKNFTA